MIKEKEKLIGELNTDVDKIHILEKSLNNLSTEYKTLMGINSKLDREFDVSLKENKSLKLKVAELESKLNGTNITFKNFKKTGNEGTKSFSNNKNFSNNKKNFSKTQPQGAQCFECSGFGHMARECPNRQKKKKKVLAATWDDSDSEKEPNNDESKSDDDNFIAFTSSICSHDSDNKVVDDEIENESQCENSEEISNLQDAYDRLYQVSTNWAGVDTPF